MLLIRSQDREMIVPLNKPVYVINQKICYGVERYGANAIVLGEYSSPRCLEVLDEIQDAFQYANHFTGTGLEDCPYDGYGVYQMPEK